jgi:hypothetical protein
MMFYVLFRVFVGVFCIGKIYGGQDHTFHF